MQPLPELETVLLTQENAVLTITLNRPDVLNAFNDALGTDLMAALRFAERESSVRCIVLTGAGRGFCAGEDLKAHLAKENRSLGDTLRNRYNPIILKLRSIEKPIIARINGVAAGAGVSLALACDVRVAIDSAKFGMAFVKIGLVPDSGAFWMLPRLIGQTRTFEWMSTGDTLPATKALEWGLINAHCPAEKLDETVAGWANAYASGPTKTYALIKRGLQTGMERGLADALEYEAYLQELAGELKDSQEGIAAFVEKRAPNFTGE